MTYSFVKPDSGPSPKDDVAQIRTNFSQFASIFSFASGAAIANHMAMNDRNQGKHAAIIFENRASDPGVTEDLDVLYNKNATAKTSGPQPQLFVQIPKFLPNSNDTNNAENLGIQLTYNTVNTAGPVYQSFLPGGYIFYFGMATGTTAPNTNIAQTVILSPAPTKILIANATSNTFTTVGSLEPFSVSTEINTSTNDRFIIHSKANLSGPPIAYVFSWLAIAQA